MRAILMFRIRFEIDFADERASDGRDLLLVVILWFVVGGLELQCDDLGDHDQHLHHVQSLGVPLHHLAQGVDEVGAQVLVFPCHLT